MQGGCVQKTEAWKPKQLLSTAIKSEGWVRSYHSLQKFKGCKRKETQAQEPLGAVINTIYSMLEGGGTNASDVWEKKGAQLRNAALAVIVSVSMLYLG